MHQDIVVASEIEERLPSRPLQPVAALSAIRRGAVFSGPMTSWMRLCFFVSNG